MTEDKPKTKAEESLNADEPSEIPADEKWLIRECDTYYDEYKECTSFKGRFHQYFIFGEALDCNQWKKDYNNCCNYEANQDCKAGLALIKSEQARRLDRLHIHQSIFQLALIKSEQARRLDRLRPHYRNSIWKKREAPPDDWNKPLPEWLIKRDENTYLAEKAREIREGKVIEESKSFCVIM